MGVGIEYGIISFVFAFIGANIIIDLLTKKTFVISQLETHPVESVLLLIVLPLAIRFILIFLSYNEEVISNSAYILGKIGNPTAIDNIILSFKRIGFSRNKLAHPLSLFGRKAIPNLVEGFSSADYSIKKGCIETLGLIGDEKNVEILIDLLERHDPNLTWTITSALQKIDDPRVGPALAQTIYLKGGGCSNLLALIQNSEKFGDYKPFDAHLLGLLEKAVDKSLPSFNRGFGVRAIGSYGYPEGLAKLQELIDDKEELMNIRLDAINGLASIRSPEAIKKLLSLYEESQDNSPIQNAAWNALASIKHSNIGSELYQALQHKDPYIRLAAVRSLGLIGNQDSMRFLDSVAASDEKSVIRKEVAVVLGKIGGDRSVDLLQAMCKDSEHDVRQVALQCLDLYLPDSAKRIFMELAADNAYPERVKVIELLGSYRFPDVQDKLLDLCADTNVNVKIQAAESLQRIDLSLTDELKYITLPKGRHLAYKPFLLLRKKLHFDEYQRLADELRFSGVEKLGLFSAMFSRIQKDSELKRKFRYIATAYMTASLILFIIIPSVFLSIYVRSVLFLGKFILDRSYLSDLSLWFIGVTIISFLPFVRNVYEPYKVMRSLMRATRIWGIAVALILFSYILISYWVIFLIMLLIVILIGWKFQNRLTNWINALISWRQKILMGNT